MTCCFQRSFRKTARLVALTALGWAAVDGCVGTSAFAAAGQAGRAADVAEEYPAALAAAAAAPMVQFSALFERAVRLRAQQDGIDQAHARILVRRELAAKEAAKGNWAEASLHYGNALQIAEALQDAHAQLQLNLDRARALLASGNRWEAIAHARAAWEIAQMLGRANSQIEAGLLLAGLLHDSGKPKDAEPYYRAMLALPGVDQLAVELHRAQHRSGQSYAEMKEHWRQVAVLARKRGNAVTEARAFNELGFVAALEDNLPEALEQFREADKLAPAHVRGTQQWEAYSRALEQTGDRAGARRAIERALADGDAQNEPLAIATLHDAHAALLADAGDYAAAYAALRRAQALRAKPQATELRTSAARMVAVTANRETEQAATIAAARNALRESELASSHLRQRMAMGAGVAALLLAAALGRAYYFKRRAAAVLATARDVAELRAERTHWQMLRYQLNPHFLFNALTSIRSQIPPGLVRARDSIDRLADFCRMTLHTPRADERVSLAVEIDLLRAYLNIEHSRLGPLLVVKFAVEEAVMQERLPRLLLLPLVENALKYGAATSADRLEIRIGARAVANGLEIEIANSGQWVDKPGDRAVASLRVGHDNLRERLKRYYPNDHEFTRDASDGWVRVKLRLGRAIAAADIWAEATEAARKKRFA